MTNLFAKGHKNNPMTTDEINAAGNAQVDSNAKWTDYEARKAEKVAARQALRATFATPQEWQAFLIKEAQEKAAAKANGYEGADGIWVS